MVQAPIPRLIGPADMPVLAALHALCFEQPWDQDALQTLVLAPGGFGCLSLDPTENAPCGFALGRVAATECELLSIGMVPAYRQRGWGAALIGSLVSEAARRGADRVLLEVAEDNRAAIALYRATGFEKVGLRRAYYRRPDGAIDAAILRLVIGDEARPSRDIHDQSVD